MKPRYQNSFLLGSEISFAFFFQINFLVTFFIFMMSPTIEKRTLNNKFFKGSWPI